MTVWVLLGLKKQKRIKTTLISGMVTKFTNSHRALLNRKIKVVEMLPDSQKSSWANSGVLGFAVFKQNTIS